MKPSDYEGFYIYIYFFFKTCLREYIFFIGKMLLNYAISILTAVYV